MGWHGGVFLSNAKHLGVNLKEIDAVVISHQHWDHAGSLPQVLEYLDKPNIYLPYKYSKSQTNDIMRFKPDCKIFALEKYRVLSEISEYIAVTGTFKRKGPIEEQAILVKDPKTKEVTVIVGCSHPGIEDFVNSGNKFGKVTTLMGGLHGFKNVDFIKESTMENIYIGHCTKHMDLFKNIPNVTYHNIFVGKSLGSAPNS